MRRLRASLTLGAVVLAIFSLASAAQAQYPAYDPGTASIYSGNAYTPLPNYSGGYVNRWQPTPRAWGQNRWSNVPGSFYDYQRPSWGDFGQVPYSRIPYTRIPYTRIPYSGSVYYGNY